MVDAQGAGTVFVFQAFEDSTSVLEGLTLTGGVGSTGPEVRGGGITCRPDSSPRI